MGQSFGSKPASPTPGPLVLGSDRSSRASRVGRTGGRLPFFAVETDRDIFRLNRDMRWLLSGSGLRDNGSGSRPARKPDAGASHARGVQGLHTKGLAKKPGWVGNDPA